MVKYMFKRAREGLPRLPHIGEIVFQSTVFSFTSHENKENLHTREEENVRNHGQNPFQVVVQGKQQEKCRYN